MDLQNENLEKIKSQRKYHKIGKRVIKTHQIHQNNRKSYKIILKNKINRKLSSQ